MKNLLMTIIALIGFVQLGSAQVALGTISGKTFDDDSITVVPFARVWVEVGGTQRGTQSDIDGKYKIDGLKPGTYTVHAKTTLKGEVQVAEVKVNGGITTADIIMNNPNVLKPVVVVHNPLKIEKDIPRITLMAEDIEHSPNIRNPKELFASMNSDIIIPEGSSDVIIRGSRPGDVIYYIDGVKVNDLNGVPGVGIGSMTGYTGGVPAKYGDTTGGVVVLETKSYFDLYYAWLAGQK